MPPIQRTSLPGATPQRESNRASGYQRWVERWFNTETGFVRDTTRQLSWNVRTFPTRFSGIRGDTLDNWDASLFGSIVSQRGYSRRVQLQFRLQY